MSLSGSILLIGGSGGLGQALNRQLQKYGEKVVAWPRIGLNQSLPEVPDDIYAVIYAAQSDDVRSECITDDLLWVNAILPSKIAIKCAEKGVNSFVYCSTGSVYAPSSTDLFETSPQVEPHKSTPYVSSKRDGEKSLIKLASSIPNIIVIRPFFLFGIGARLDRLFSQLLKRIKDRQAINITQGTGLIFNPCPLTDAASFIRNQLSSDAGFRIYNVAGAEVFSIFEVSNWLGEAMGKVPIYSGDDEPVSRIVADVTKMRETGFDWPRSLKNHVTDFAHHYG